MGVTGDGGEHLSVVLCVSTYMHRSGAVAHHK